jgi:Response regulators consisting of a CheY-like receiver domain and a winged-helix DNA-binding domain
MKILIIEDDKKTASFITKGFREAGFAVDHAYDGNDGFYMVTTNDYDALIVDIMLPSIDGLSLIETIRKKQISTPAIILSAKRSVEEKVRGLQKGGDDYLTKPFSFSELLARVHALIRRSSFTEDSSVLDIGDLNVDLASRRVERGGKTFDLPQREFILLEYLIRNRDRVVSKTMILEHVWDYSFDPGSNVVDVLLCRLRNKIDKDFPVKLIHTVRGAGYVFKTPSTT